MWMLKAFAALPAAAACLVMALAPALAQLPPISEGPPGQAPVMQPCLGNRFTNGDFTQTSGNPDAVSHQDINLAAGWEPIWQESASGLNSLADLYGPTASGASTLPTPASGNYASMWIANGTFSAIQYREGMLNRLTSAILANTGVYSFTFRTAALAPAQTPIGVPSVVAIYGVRRALGSALAAPPTGLNAPTNLGLFPGDAVLLGQVQIPASANNTWVSHTISFDSASFGSLAGITHVMVTKADGFPTRTRYIAFDGFCMLDAVSAALPAFNPCCPPWNAMRLSAMLSMQRTGLAAKPYQIRFAPTAQLHSQMNAYIAYLQSLNIGFTQMGIVFQLSDAGAAPSTGGAALENIPIHWNGTGTPGASFFDTRLLANRWYQVRTLIFPSGGPSGFVPANCSGDSIYVRWQPLQGGAAEVLLRYSDGRTDERVIVP